MSGPFITFEGIDGAGKSTHIGGVAERLRQRAHGAGVAPEDPGRAPGDLPVAERNDGGRPPNLSSARAAEGPRTSLPREVVLTREPGGTELAERLRHLVLHTPMDTLTEVLLVFAARRDHLHRVIVPALARGATVLCDRFTDATFAYQGAGRGFDRDVLQQLETWVHGGLTPDLTFWFDLPPEVAVERLAQARAPDRFEVEGAAFFHRVREGYRARADSHPGRFVRIDAEQDRVAVARQVDAVLSERGW